MKPKTYSETIAEIKKGCKGWNDNCLVQFSEGCNNFHLCKRCKTTLKAYQDCRKLVMQEVEDALNNLAEEDIKKCDSFVINSDELLTSLTYGELKQKLKLNGQQENIRSRILPDESGKRAKQKEFSAETNSHECSSPVDTNNSEVKK